MSDRLRDSRVEYHRAEAAGALDEETRLRALQALVLEAPEDANAHYEYGRALSRTGRDDATAIDHLRQTLARDPAHNGARLALGAIHHRRREYDLAHAMYEGALDLNPRLFRAWLGLGALALERRDYAGAERAYRRAAQIRPRDWRPRSGLAKALHALGRYEDALDAWNATLAREPREPGALRGVARARAALADPRAKAAYEEAVAANPQSVSLREGLAYLLAQEGDTEGAGSVLREGAAADPQSPRPWIALARFLAGQDRTGEAVEVLREGLVQTAGDNSVRLALVRTLARMERLEEAIRELRPIAIADPSHAEARRLMAVLQACQGQYDEAASTAFAALRLQPSVPWPRLLLIRVPNQPMHPMAVNVADPKTLPSHRGFALTVRGILELAMGSHRRAGRLLEEALEAAPETPVPRLGRALVYMASGNMESAYAELRTAAILEPSSFHIQHLFGEAAFHIGRYEEAAKAFQAALSCEESDGLLRGLTCFCRARAFRKRGMAREAIECYQEAQRLAPEHAPSFFACGVALQELGRKDEALRQYERAATLSPTHAPSLAGMASCLEAVGRAPEAVEAYRAAIKADPNYALPRYNLAVLIERSGDPSEIAALLRGYLRLAPNAPNAEDARRRLTVAELRASGVLSRPQPEPDEAEAAFLESTDDNLSTHSPAREAPIDPRLRA